MALLQSNLYYRTQMTTKVSLLPDQMNADIDDNLLFNLKKKIINKVISVGIVLKVIKIIDYDYGVIDKSNFMSCFVYNIKFDCYLCSPVKDNEIVCVVENIVKKLIFAKNGPVIVTIPHNSIDSQKFFIKDANTVVHTKTNTPIKTGAFLKVLIASTRNNRGESQIIVIGKLLDMADKNDIASYNKDMEIVNDSDAPFKINNDDDDEFI